MKRLKEILRWKAEKLELVPGSGNGFRDLRRENADIEQLKSLLAAEITKGARPARTDRPRRSCPNWLRCGRLFAHPHNAELARFTADRLMSILNRLGSQVEVKIRVRRVEPLQGEARA